MTICDFFYWVCRLFFFFGFCACVFLCFCFFQSWFIFFIFHFFKQFERNIFKKVLSKNPRDFVFLIFIFFITGFTGFTGFLLLLPLYYFLFLSYTWLSGFYVSGSKTIITISLFYYFIYTL